MSPYLHPGCLVGCFLGALGAAGEHGRLAARERYAGSGRGIGGVSGGFGASPSGTVQFSGAAAGRRDAPAQEHCLLGPWAVHEVQNSTRRCNNCNR